MASEICPRCGRRVRTVARLGRGGVLQFFVRHKNAAGDACDTSRCLATERPEETPTP